MVCCSLQIIGFENKSASFNCDYTSSTFELSENSSSSGLNLTKDGNILVSVLSINDIYNFNNSRLAMNGLPSNTLLFTLKSIETSDAGNYTCITQDANGTVYQSVELIVIGKL